MNFGENGGVRCRTGDGGVGSVGGGGGAAANGWLGGGAFDGVGANGARGTGGSARGTGGSARGTGGGQAFDGGGADGVRDRVIGFALELPIAAGAGTVGKSSPQLTAAPTGISPPQIEQRARIETLVIFAGSSRNTDRHSGQETFIET